MEKRKKRRSNLLLLIPVLLVLVGILLYPREGRDQPQRLEDRLDYNADKEVSAAIRGLATNEKTAKILTQVDTDENLISVNLFGLMSQESNQKLLQLLEDDHQGLEFYISGTKMAENRGLVSDLLSKGIPVNNNSLSAKRKMEALSQEEQVEDFVRSSMIYQKIAKSPSRKLACDGTLYTKELKEAAYLAGFDYLLEPTVYLNYQSFKDYEELLAYFRKVQRGSIVAIRLDGVLLEGEYAQKTQNSDPAHDKQATISDEEAEVKSDRDPEEASLQLVEWLLRAMKELDLTSLAAEELILYERQDGPELSLGQTWQAYLNPLEIRPIAGKSFASKQAGAGADRLDSQERWIGAEKIEQIRRANAGKLAEEIEQVYTTEQALSFGFYGVSNEEGLDRSLETLRKEGVQASFFLSRKDWLGHRAAIERIVQEGHELEIALDLNRNLDYESTLRDLIFIGEEIQALTGRKPSLVRPAYQLELEDEVLEAISSLGYRVIWQDIAVANSRIGKAANLDQLREAIFHDGNLYAHRGQLVFFRLDYYEDLDLIPQMIDYFMETKVRTLAYDDDPSGWTSYRLIPMSQLVESPYIYTYPVTEDRILPALKGRVGPGHLGQMDQAARFEYIREHYVGNPYINSQSNLPGFTKEEVSQLDTSGRFTEDKVLFLTFDDWASDKAINQILYVLKKHDVKASFFIRTNYMLNNPSALRAIGLEGHDIGSHTDRHIPFAKLNDGSVQLEEEDSSQHYLSLSEEEVALQKEDLQRSYDKLVSVVGDLSFYDRPVINTILRPPTLAMSREGMEAILDMGFSHIVSGDFSSKDYEDKKAEDLVDKFVKGIRSQGGNLLKLENGSIVVMHMTDFKKNEDHMQSVNLTAKGLDLLIPLLKEQGYHFARLSDYID